MKKNIVFGSSGLVGSAFYELLKNDKNFIFFSKNNKKFEKFNLNNNIKKFPIKEVNNCYFFSSPRVLKKNFINNKFKLELEWLRKIVSNIKIKPFMSFGKMPMANGFLKKKNFKKVLDDGEFINFGKKLFYSALSAENTEKSIEVEQNGIDYLQSIFGSDTTWVQCSFNTWKNKHKLSGTPLRYNMAEIGYTYDSLRDAFIPPKPGNGYILIERTLQWTSTADFSNDYINRLKTFRSDI